MFAVVIRSLFTCVQEGVFPPQKLGVVTEFWGIAGALIQKWFLRSASLVGNCCLISYIHSMMI